MSGRFWLAFRVAGCSCLVSAGRVSHVFQLLLLVTTRAERRTRDTWYGVEAWFKRQNISNRSQITTSLLRNLQEIAFCARLDLFGKWNRRSLYSACNMEWKQCSNVKYLKQERNYSKSQAKYSSNCILRCAVLCWFRLKQACTTFDVQDGMRTAFNSQNITNTSEIAVSSCQNIEEIAFCLLYRCELYAKVCWS